MQEASDERTKTLEQILTRQRNTELAKVRQFRRDEAQDAVEGPGDELDVARADLDVDLHVSLVGLSEQRLKAIDDAINRLERDLYGFCARCGNEIPVERLKVLPFTIYCIDCQAEREVTRSAGAITEEYSTRWTIPEELDESLERQDTLNSPEEEMPVRNESPFGPEEGEFEQMPPTPTARRRGRLRKRRQSD